MEQLLHHADAAARRAGADLAGWLDHDFGTALGERAERDESEEVHDAAIEALARRRRFAQAAELLAALRESEGLRAWVYAEAAISVGDAALMANTGDPLNIFSAVEQQPVALRRFIEDRLSQRAKEIEEDTRSRDRRREEHLG